MRVLVDLDGTICALRKPGQTYADLEPLPGAVDRLRTLKHQGHYIIIATARNMQTTGGNVGQVMKNVGMVTLEWLQQHGVEYDEIHFGKPNADVYLDDRALRFQSWDRLTDSVLQDAVTTSETLKRT